MAPKSKGGRKSKAEELGIIKKLKANPLPELGETLADIMKYNAEVIRRLAVGDIETARALALIKACQLQKACIERRSEEADLERWEQVLERAETVVAKADARAASEGQAKQ